MPTGRKTPHTTPNCFIFFMYSICISISSSAYVHINIFSLPFSSVFFLHPFRNLISLLISCLSLSTPPSWIIPRKYDRPSRHIQVYIYLGLTDGHVHCPGWGQGVCTYVCSGWLCVPKSTCGCVHARTWSYVQAVRSNIIRRH